MSETNHAAAIVVRDDEPVGIAVEVDPELLEEVGEDALLDAIQGNPWVNRQRIPVVAGYVFDDELFLFGPDDLADYVAEAWDDLSWNHEIAIEWEDED